MLMQIRLLVLAASVMAMLLPAGAQDRSSQPGIGSVRQMSLVPREPSALQRAEIARELVAKWQSAADKRQGGGGARWRTLLTGLVAKADARNVLAATSALSLDGMHDALTGLKTAATSPARRSAGIGNGTVAPQTLGNIYNDLVYTPLPNGRCRVADSRPINSPLQGTRALNIEGMASYAAQGGTGTHSNGNSSAACGIPAVANSYVLSVTLLLPTESGAFKLFAYGSAFQTGNTIMMNAGSAGESADLIVSSCRMCNFDINIQSGGPVHYIVDVIGFYKAPAATPLYCYLDVNYHYYFNPGQTGSFAFKTCVSGYTETATYCTASSYDVTFSETLNTCRAKNWGTTSATISAFTRCCQISGE